MYYVADSCNARRNQRCLTHPGMSHRAEISYPMSFLTNAKTGVGNTGKNTVLRNIPEYGADQSFLEAYPHDRNQVLPTNW